MRDEDFNLSIDEIYTFLTFVRIKSMMGLLTTTINGWLHDFMKEVQEDENSEIEFKNNASEILVTLSNSLGKIFEDLKKELNEVVATSAFKNLKRILDALEKYVVSRQTSQNSAATMH